MSLTPIRTNPDDLLGSPMLPPRRYFDLPDDYDPVHDSTQPLIRVYTAGADVGRIAALVAPLNSCVLDGFEARGRCVMPPPDGSGYEYAAVGHTPLDDGGTISSANIAGGLNHASPFVSASAAVSHYANSGHRQARVRYFVDHTLGGIFATGSLDPNRTVWDALTLTASALSGDWRFIDELDDWRMIASQVVNVPGFRPAFRGPRPTTATAALRASADAPGVRQFWWSPVQAAAREFSPDLRRRYAHDGVAMPDGSFPIPDGGALRRAIQAFGRAKNKAATRAHIIRRARALDLTTELPDGWA